MSNEILQCRQYIDIVLLCAEESRNPTQQEKLTMLAFPGFGSVAGPLAALEGGYLNAEELRHTDDLNKIKSSIERIVHLKFSQDGERLKRIRQVNLSTLSSYYTPGFVTEPLAKELTEMIKAVYQHMPYQDPIKVLEPSAGNGRMIYSLDRNKKHLTQYDAFEPNVISAASIHQQNTTVFNAGFEDIGTFRPNNKYHLIVTNCPFGDIKVLDKDYYQNGAAVQKNSMNRIHNYFMVKSAELLEPGGIMAIINTTAFNTTPGNKEFREEILRGNDLIANVLLPTNLFSLQNTEVQTSLIIIQKPFTPKYVLTKAEEDFVNNLDTENYQQYNFFDSIEQRTNKFGKEYTYYNLDDLKSLFTGLREIINIRKVAQLQIQRPITKNKIPLAPVNDLQLDLFGMATAKVNSLIAKKEIEKQSTKPLSVTIAGEDLKWVSFNNYIDVHPKYFNGLPYRLTLNPEDGRLNLANLLPSKDGKKTYNLIEVKLLLSIRNIYLDLKDNEIELNKSFDSKRKDLNAAYDKYFAAYGSLRNSKSLALFKDAEIFKGLEKGNKIDGYSKADVFFKSTFITEEIKEPTNLSFSDALVYNMNISSRVDLQLLERLTGETEFIVIDNLIGEILFDPQEQSWQYRNNYLSGDIISKIDAVQENLKSADVGSENFKYLTATAHALQEVKPERIPYSDIVINLGSRWLPVEYYNQFASKLLQEDISFKYLTGVDQYIASSHPRNELISTTYAADTYNRKYSAIDMLEFSLVDSMPKATKKVKYGDKEVTIPDENGLRNLKFMNETLKNEFESFLTTLEKPERERIADIYNNIYNRTKKFEPDGRILGFNDIQIFEPRLTQKNSVAHIMQNKGGVIDLPVGEGKTLVMVMAAHEMKRLGIIKKPMIIAMKANVDAIAKDYITAYPNDKVLYPSTIEYSKLNRLEIFHKICNNDWDCIILSHDQFKAIPQEPAIVEALMVKEINNLQIDYNAVSEMDGQQSKAAAKGLIKRINSLEIKLEKFLLDIQSNKDDFIDFSKMQIDHLFVDESHNFKNLFYTTRHHNISGLGNPEGSQKAFNLYCAVKSLQQQNGGDMNVTFLTASTIKNSLVELYTLFKYMIPTKLDQMYCSTFDTWAANFAIKSTDFEFSVTGQIQQKERFRGYVNIPELCKIYNDMTYYMNPKDSKLDKPLKDEINVLIEPTEQQKVYMDKLVRFASTGDPEILGLNHLTPDNAKKAKMAIACSLGKLMTLDMRAINEHQYHDEEGNKLDIAATNIAEIYFKFKGEKGTQFVFCDVSTPKKEFNAYQALKEKLQHKYLIPGEEIRFIHEASSEKKRDQMLTKFRNGEIRIMFGSTSKLGTGVNGQNKVTAIHHLDFPWTPEDLNQREGRGLRFGNILAKESNNNEVQIYTYATKYTIDVFRVQTLKNKKEFISQIKDSDIRLRRIDEPELDETSTMSYTEFVSLLSGNTDLLDKTKIDLKISELEKEKNTYNRSILKAKVQLEDNINNLVRKQHLLTRLSQDYELLHKNEDVKEIKFLGKDYKETKDLANTLHSQFFKLSVNAEKGMVQAVAGNIRENHTNLGMYKGFTIKYNVEHNELQVSGPGAINYKTVEGYPNININFTARYFDVALQSVERIKNSTELTITKLEKDIEILSSHNTTAWSKQEQLNSLYKEAELLDLKIKTQTNMENQTEKTKVLPEGELNITNESPKGDEENNIVNLSAEEKNNYLNVVEPNSKDTGHDDSMLSEPDLNEYGKPVYDNAFLDKQLMDFASKLDFTENCMLENYDNLKEVLDILNKGENPFNLSNKSIRDASTIQLYLQIFAGKDIKIEREHIHSFIKTMNEKADLQATLSMEIKGHTINCLIRNQGSLFVNGITISKDDTKQFVRMPVAENSGYFNYRTALNLLDGKSVLVEKVEWPGKKPENTWLQIGEKFKRTITNGANGREYSLECIDDTKKLRYYPENQFTIPDKLGGAKISDEDRSWLLKGETILHTATNKDGKPYVCELFVNAKEFKMDFKIADKENQLKNIPEVKLDDAKRMRSEINLPEFLNYKFGYQVTRSGDNYEVKTDTMAGKINCKLDSRYNSKNWLFFDNKNGKTGNLITFLTEYKNYGNGSDPKVMEQIKKECMEFDSAFNVEQGGRQYEYTQPKQSEIKEIPDLNVYPLVASEFLLTRGISKDIIASEKYCTLLLNKPYINEHNKAGAINSAFPIRDADFNIVDVSMKNVSYNGKNFSSFAKNGNRNMGLAYSTINEAAYSDYKIFVVGEAVLDVLSYCQLNPQYLSNTADFSFEGQVTSTQIEVLNTFLARCQPEKIILVNDKDYAGYSFDCTILGNLGRTKGIDTVYDFKFGHSTNQIDSYLDITLSIPKSLQDNNPEKMIEFIKLGKLYRSIQSLKVTKEPVLTYNNTTGTYKIVATFKRLHNEVEKDFPFHQSVVDVCKDFFSVGTQEIIIEKASNKDFNADLMETKSLSKDSVMANNNVWKGMNISQINNFMKDNEITQPCMATQNGLSLQRD